MSVHEEWVRQITAELDGELTLPERAALAHHLAGCTACAGARQLPGASGGARAFGGSARCASGSALPIEA
jgi:anti-sigma factor RsiW